MQLPDLEEFAKTEDLALVLLFGSRAQEDGWRADSDFDLALQPRDLDADSDGIEARLVNALRRSDLDLLWLPHASALARARVATTAKVLYEDEPHRFRHFVQDASLRKDDGRIWAESDLRYVVHQYEEVRLPKLFKACKESLPDWRVYLAALTQRLRETL